jgi:hypothetical protein
MMYTTLVLSNNIQQRYNNDIASSYAYIASLVVVLPSTSTSQLCSYILYIPHTITINHT